MKRFFCCLFIGLLQVGCHYEAPRGPTTLQEIDAAFKAEAQIEDERIKKGSPPLLPDQLQETIVQGSGVDAAALQKEARFDVMVSEVSARSFFMGLVDGTDSSMLVHPKVDGNISLALKNVTVDGVLQAVREVYGYGYEKTDYGYSVLPASLQTRTYQVDFLNVERQGTTSMQVNSSSQSSGSGSSGSGSGSGSSGSGSSGSGSSGSGSSGSGSSGSGSGSSGSGSGSGEGSSSSSGSVSAGVGVNTQFLSNPWKELVTSIKAIIGSEGGRAVIPSPQSGLLVVKAMPVELRAVEAYLGRAHHSALRQVVLEAKVLEVILDDSHQAGINWAAVSHLHGGNLITSQIASDIKGTGVNLADGLSTSVTSAIISPTTGTFNAGGAFTTAAALTGSHGAFQALLNLKRFESFIALLSTQGNVQVLSSPRISTVNNQKAIIKVGKDKYYATNASSSTTTGTATTTSASLTIQPFFSGISLDVTPEISDDGMVTLHIHPNVSTVSQDTVSATIGTSGTTSVPTATTTVRESDSVIRSESGQIVVLGGLMQNQMTEGLTAVPLLGDIPFLGSFFRTTVQEKVKSELVILLKPTVIRSSKGWQHYTEGLRENFASMDQPFHKGTKTKLFGNLGEKAS